MIPSLFLWLKYLLARHLEIQPAPPFHYFEIQSIPDFIIATIVTAASDSNQSWQPHFIV